MLTRDLLQFRRRNGLVPLFVKREDPAARECAESLLALFAEAGENGMTRGELEELAAVLVKGSHDPKFSAGLCKLLLDHTDFALSGSDDWSGRRENFFREAAELMKEETEWTLEEYCRKIGTLKAAFPGNDPYCDLPELETVTRAPRWTPSELLDRYNVALVQGLLLEAERVTFTLPQCEPAQLRKIFKYLKFFRLLGELSYSKEEPDTLLLQVSGPFELFENTRKYALQLANFFPAVVTAPRWRLDAKIRTGRASAEKLHLDEASGLRSSYRNFSAYVPEEIRLYHDHFRKTQKEWEIVGETPFFPDGGGGLLFPDLSFRRTCDGTTLHLELFHRWHRGQLLRRLELLDREKDLPLLLGIDTAIADDEIRAWLEAHPAVAQGIFTFRDFPGVEKTREALERKSRQK